MTNLLILFLILLVVLLLGILVYTIQINKKNKENTKKEIEELILKNSKLSEINEKEAISKASKIAKKIVTEAEQKAIDLENNIQNKAKKIREQLKEQEENLNERERQLIERSKTIDNQFNLLGQKEQEIEHQKEELQKVKQEYIKKLEELSNTSKEEATRLLQESIEINIKDWIAKKVKEAEQEIKFKSDEIAKNILIESMINASTDYVSEATTTTIDIDNEEVKSKLIGKQGRNIRTFEKLTGVDLIIDDTPNVITLSCFDPIRREVAALTLKKLIADGRIHPASIEETVENVKKEVLKEIKKTGEDMAFQCGLNDLPIELIMLIGRFKYRFSYGQNLVKHTLEVVKVGEYLAKELGADVRTTKLACLLHDIGKVAPEEGKQHHHISAEIAKKYYNNPKLTNAIEAHHYDIEAKCLEAEIVRIADAISGARPGARNDSYEEHVKRIRAIEEIGLKHKGVKEVFAVRAGREIRVILLPEETSDEDVSIIALKIAQEIESTQTYPGVIKVNVIREVKGTAEAK